MMENYKTDMHNPDDDLPDEEYDDMEDNFDDDDDETDEEDEFENAMDECGQMANGLCSMAGSEYCDWECPFSKQMYANMNRKRDANGRFCK